MSARGGKIVIASVAVVASWFFGVNFWKPLVMYVYQTSTRQVSDIQENTNKIIVK